MKSKLLILSFFAIVNISFSQVSLRIMPLEVYKYLDTKGGDGPRGTWNIGVGLIAQAKNNLAISVDYKVDLVRSLSDNLFYVEENNNNEDYYTTYSVQVSELMYKSSYLFRGNEELSPYVGSGIGVRWHRLRAEVDYYDYNSSDSDLIDIDEKKNTYPLALYGGLMSENDGGFTDFYIGYSFNLGYKNEWRTDDGLYGIHAPLVAGGIIFGISWNICPENL